MPGIWIFQGAVFWKTQVWIGDESTNNRKVNSKESWGLTENQSSRKKRAMTFPGAKTPIKRAQLLHT